MSQLIDYMLKSEPGAMDTETSMVDINHMDFNFDTPEMMTSDFFDSVLSLEKDNIFGDKRFFNQFDDDDQLLNDSFGSEGDASTLQKSPATDSGSMDSDNFDERITIFGNQANETLTTDFYTTFESDLANFINEAPVKTIPPKIKRAINLPIVANANHQKKVIIKPVANNASQPINSNKKQLATGKNQVIRVQAGGRSLLLPVNVKDIKKLKIIHANDFKLLPTTAKPVFKKVVPVDYAASTSSSCESVDIDDEDIDIGNTANAEGTYPPLVLTGEEKRLLAKEGIKLPSHYPLTKYEEKELKRIRRKIRNKISAQDSRKRKKEYVDQLEEKARRTDKENELLKNRVKSLNRENTRLSEQLKKLQELLSSGATKATPTTCLMIVLFSTLLVCLPNLKASDGKDIAEIGKEQQIMAARRALLFNTPSKDEEEQMSMDEFLVFNQGSQSEEDEKENGTSAAFVKYLGDLSTKYETIIRSNCSEMLQTGSLHDYCKRHEDDFKLALQELRVFLNRNQANQMKEDSSTERRFIEPDISDDEDGGEMLITKGRFGYLMDDDDPPTKKVRISAADSSNLEYDARKALHTQRE